MPRDLFRRILEMIDDLRQSSGGAMLTSEVTKALLPPTGEVRPKIGLTARTGAWTGAAAPGRARSLRKS